MNSPRVSRTIAFLGLAGIFALLLACSGRRAEATAPNPTAEAPPPPPPPLVADPSAVTIVKGEPPATSELALMMREMAAFTDSTRDRLITGGALLPFPSSFRNMAQAEPTPNMVDHRTFDPYAKAWLVHLDRLYAASMEQRTGVFNTLVATCEACHTNMCPGPLVRIKKLHIPE